MFVIAVLIVSAIVVLHIILRLRENWDFGKKLPFVIATSFELVSKLLHWFTPITSPSAGVGNSAINPSVGLSPLRDAVSFPAYSPMLSSRLAQRCLLLDNAMLPESPRVGGVVVEIIDQGGDYRLSRPRERKRELRHSGCVCTVGCFRLKARKVFAFKACTWHVTCAVFEVVECESWTNRSEVESFS